METFGVVGVPRMPMVDLVSGAGLVERHCVAKIADGRVGIREWEGVRYHTNGTDTIPSAKKVYPDIDREGLLEVFTLLPSKLVFASIHLICKGDLLVVPWG